MGLFSGLFGGATPTPQPATPAPADRPWVSTLTASEMRLARSHGVRPLGLVAGTCVIHFPFSWTRGHAQGWQAAQDRMRAEAAALGANAVLDVKMRTVELGAEETMDYSLVGTAVKIDGLRPSAAPVLSTVPALEFVQLLEAGIVPVGLAIGAEYDWSAEDIDWRGRWNGEFSNFHERQTTEFWEQVRRKAHAQLRAHAAEQGNGVLAQLHFSQIFKREFERNDTEHFQFLGRHIVLGTVVQTPPQRLAPSLAPVQFMLDLSDRGALRTSGTVHHNSYADGI